MQPALHAYTKPNISL